MHRAGPCDVTKKEELEKLVMEIESKEKQVNLLGESFSLPILLDAISKVPCLFGVLGSFPSACACGTSLLFDQVAEVVVPVTSGEKIGVVRLL